HHRIASVDHSVAHRGAAGTTALTRRSSAEAPAEVSHRALSRAGAGRRGGAARCNRATSAQLFASRVRTERAENQRAVEADAVGSRCDSLGFLVASETNRGELVAQPARRPPGQ